VRKKGSGQRRERNRRRMEQLELKSEMNEWRWKVDGAFVCERVLEVGRRSCH